MTAFRVRFDGDVALPCKCQGAENPPSLGGVVDLYKELGEHLAVGELARRAGIVAGADLIDRASQLAASLSGGGETGGVLSLLAAIPEGVAKYAGKAWRAMAEHPGAFTGFATIGVVVGAVSMGHAWLNQRQELLLEESRDLRTRAGAALDLIPPAERAKLYVGQNPWGGGSSWTDALPWIGLAIAALVVWKVAK